MRLHTTFNLNADQSSSIEIMATPSSPIAAAYALMLSRLMFEHEFLGK